MKTWMRNLLVILFGMNGAYYSAQNYPMTAANNGTTKTTCSGVFTDDGSSGNYSNNITNRTITFCPGTPNRYLRFNFTLFDTEDWNDDFDVLEVFYGPTATGIPDEIFSGDLAAFVLTAQNVDECITFRFNSDSSVNYAGWSANISCIAPCSPPVAAYNGTTETNVCESEPNHTVSFDASASYSTDAFPITQYIWDWGDGTTSTTTSPVTNHTFPNDYGIYQVQLKVKNNNTFYSNGCYSTNAAVHTVRILPPPDFSGTSSSPLNANCGETIEVTGVASSQTIIGEGEIRYSESLILPDGLNAAYISPIDMTGLFPSGATVSATCLPKIKLDLEHSWAGDLIITLIAPSGQQVILFDGNTTAAGSKKFGYCVNALDNEIPGCTAPYYVVNSGGLLWNAATSVHTYTQTCAEYAGACESGSYFKQNRNFNSTQPLTGLIGAQLNGVWRLRILDDAGLDDGFLKSWSMSFANECYANVETVTPILSGGLWSPIGTAPIIDGTQVVTNIPHNTTGIDPCPTGADCIGNQLSNTTTLGPFSESGTFNYIFTVTDDFGCMHSQTIAIEVEEQDIEFNNLMLEYCQDETAQDLENTSDNGINGTWSPAAIDTSQLGETTYTFTPDVNCANPFDLIINVNPKPALTEIQTN